MISQPSSFVNYSALMGGLLQEMNKVLKHLMKLGKFLESEHPHVHDQVSNARKRYYFLSRLVGSEVRFMEKKKRYKTFPEVKLAAVPLNPCKL